MAAIFAAWAGWHFLYRHGSSEAGGPLAHSDAVPNVLLVSIDTCRADRLSCYGYKRRTTPNIDAVAHDGAMFKTATTPVPLTTPAHSSMLTGMYPPTHGVHLNTYDRLADSNVTLAKTLREAGYQTAAFVAAFPLDTRFRLNQGFDTYDGRFDEEAKKVIFSHRAGETVNRPALAWLDDHAKQPFFLFLHYYDAHRPYDPHPPHTSAYTDDPYAGEIAYVDDCIGRVLDRLRTLGVYDSTLVIITADHGESLDEHGETDHGFFVYQCTMHVPLVIRMPYCRKDIQVDGNVSLVDIVPTVLDLLGLKVPGWVQGVSLRAALEGGPAPDGQRAIYGESLYAGTFGCSPLHSIIEGPWKYILAPRAELYDLSQDPDERTNLAGKQPQVAQRLRGRLEAMLKKRETAALPRAPSTVDPEAIKRLESLGYVSGGVPLPASAVDITREDPKDFLPTYMRILQTKVQFYAHHNEEAKQDLLKIAASRPELILPHELLARIALDERRPADAVEQYAKIVAMLGELKDPAKQPFGAKEDLANAYFGLGRALSEAGKLPEAISHYRKALEIRPDFADADINLGLALASRGQVDEAITAYRKALEIRPDFAEAYFNLGVVLVGRGRVDEAIDHYKKALEIKPDYADAHINLGNALAGHGQVDKAITHYRKALEIRPDFAEAYFNLGAVLAGRGRVDEAIDHYEKALEIKPDYADAHINLGLALASHGKIDEAITHYRKALEIRPDFAQAHNNLGLALASHGKIDEAITHYRKALEIGPDFAQAHINLGNALAGRGQVDEAIGHYQKALGLASARNDRALADFIQARIRLLQTGAPAGKTP
jgi:tetratricopeptide (TPR) repeat protein